VWTILDRSLYNQFHIKKIHHSLEIGYMPFWTTIITITTISRKVLPTAKMGFWSIRSYWTS